MLHPFLNLIKRSFHGNRHLALIESDNRLHGDRCMDALDPVDPEPAIPAKTPSPPRQIKPGLLANPFEGPIEAVRYTDVPARTPGGGMYRLYAICTGAASFTTFDRPTALRAWRALAEGLPVRINWTFFKEGRKPAYDILRLRVLPSHGINGTFVQDQ